MGMDVHGRDPKNEEGKYFRNNVWWWRPLAEYICLVAPAIAKGCEHWQSNDGDGLDAEASSELADVLQGQIDGGFCENYERAYKANQDALPSEECWLCMGTGVRKPVPMSGAGDLEQGGQVCNRCEGESSVRPSACNYPFSVENVQRFVAFLRGSGGFTID